MTQPDEQDRVANPKKTVDEQTEPAELIAEVAVPSDDAPDPNVLPKLVTRLTPLEEQVGMHVITALQHPKTLAVLTTVAADGSGSQQVVSIPLDANRFEQVQKLLLAAKKVKKQRVRCVGFHCHFEDDGEAEGEAEDETGKTDAKTDAKTE